MDNSKRWKKLILKSVVILELVREGSVVSVKNSKSIKLNFNINKVIQKKDCTKYFDWVEENCNIGLRKWASVKEVILVADIQFFLLKIMSWFLH